MKCLRKNVEVILWVPQQSLFPANRNRPWRRQVGWQLLLAGECSPNHSEDDVRFTVPPKWPIGLMFCIWIESAGVETGVLFAAQLVQTLRRHFLTFCSSGAMINTNSDCLGMCPKLADCFALVVLLTACQMQEKAGKRKRRSLVPGNSATLLTPCSRLQVYTQKECAWLQLAAFTCWS